MSWARVDDTFWRHEKVEPLVDAQEWQALALWLLGITYTNMKGEPSLSDFEAAMLMRVDAEEGSRVCDVLRSSGLFEDDSASKQTVFHDWQDYRSKNEAKARAGREGGKKSGETRRKKSKQTTKQGGSSASKQTRSPLPDPLPDPLPIPKSKTTPLSTSKPKPTARSLKTEILKVYSHYRTYHPRSHPKPTSKSKESKAIRERLDEGYSAEDLCKAIDGCHRSRFHAGENDRGKRYQGLGLIMRDSDHVASFLETEQHGDPRPSEPCKKRTYLDATRELIEEADRHDAAGVFGSDGEAPGQVRPTTNGPGPVAGNGPRLLRGGEKP